MSFHKGLAGIDALCIIRSVRSCLVLKLQISRHYMHYSISKQMLDSVLFIHLFKVTGSTSRADNSYIYEFSLIVELCVCLGGGGVGSLPLALCSIDKM